MKNYSFTFENKDNMEVAILLLMKSLADALREDLIETDLAERVLFRPRNMEQLKSLGVNQDILDLIACGCELDDVKRLVPSKLGKSIDKIESGSKEALIKRKKTREKFEFNR